MAKNNVKKAIESVASGDVRGLRKNIQEALVAKVRKALDIKEKKIAKSLIEAATRTPIAEGTKGKVRVTFMSTNFDGVQVPKYYVASSADDLADALYIDTKDLFDSAKDKKTFEDARAKGGEVYAWVKSKHSANLVPTLSLSTDFKKAEHGSFFESVARPALHENKASKSLQEARIGIVATSDIYAKNRNDVVLRSRQAINVQSKDDFDINNTASLGVADSKSNAEKQEEDSAGDI